MGSLRQAVMDGILRCVSFEIEMHHKKGVASPQRMGEHQEEFKKNLRVVWYGQQCPSNWPHGLR